ncbi:unnamed protein product [Paramecium sonneborni]|uniref:Uncharacterized protein n=1 Tax=Paramecium sonneborni TaxID=65129 RepID=A0A8S1M1M5_9CILI|nr:unnamed protein product [Paramecium sonneborni]
MNLVKLNKKIKILEYDVDRLDVEQNFDEAEIKDQELKLIVKEKNILIEDVKNLRKYLEGLRKALESNNILETKIALDQKLASAIQKTKKLLIIRERIRETLEEQNDENRQYLYPDELQEEEEKKFTKIKNKTKAIKKLQYPSSNCNQVFKPLELQQNQNKQQMNQIEINLYN